MSTLNVILPVVTLLIGSGLSHLIEAQRYRRSRLDQTSDALLGQRAEAYRRFIRSAHITAHLLGRAAVDSEAPLTTDDARDVYARVDSEVSRDLYELEVFADERVLAAAQAVRNTLVEFRLSVRQGAVYMSDEYRQALSKYQQARRAFLDHAREAVLARPVISARG